MNINSQWQIYTSGIGGMFAAAFGTIGPAGESAVPITVEVIATLQTEAGDNIQTEAGDPLYGDNLKTASGGTLQTEAGDSLETK